MEFRPSLKERIRASGLDENVRNVVHDALPTPSPRCYRSGLVVIREGGAGGAEDVNEAE